ncbi:MAG: hypothetical protein KYX69_15820 [Sphingomonas sp.]|uniref:hypothetical protein n=1 Tax=Sphingomonas sp. TaxID=28214 RepID=UPI002632642A|nr:hypothetical protein [Sphingomonas sp.]MDK2769176.1 hypothetical protein [Sphingomonas sp.]
MLFGAFNFVWHESALRTEQRVKAADAADDYAASADKKIRDRCLSLKAEAQLVCVTEAVKSSRESQREEYDLVAQQQAARWTMIAGGAASIGLIVSLIGIVLVWTTFRETRRSTNAAVRSYDAFVKFESPMIDIDFSEYSVLYHNGRPMVLAYLVVRNIGRSPAIIIDVCVQGDESRTYSRIIASGEKLPLKDPFQFYIPESGAVYGYIEFLTAVSPGKKRIFVMGFEKMEPGWRASIHPNDILDHDDPSYDRPLEDIDRR